MAARVDRPTIAPQRARSLSDPPPGPERGVAPGSSGPGTGTERAQALPPDGRLPPSREERRFFKPKAARGERRTPPTLPPFPGGQARPNRDPVIATGTEGGCESRVVGAV